MPRPIHRRTHPGALPALVLALLVALLGLTGCGGSAPKATATTTGQDVSECQEQWREVGESVLGLDQDIDPSALASRWTAVIASIDYYATNDDATDCQERIEAQVKAITSLRLFTEKLRPYDMSYQLRQVRAAIDLYLHDPLPKAARNENGVLVRPPGKNAVAAAYRTLSSTASAADAELQPGWGQMASVTLDDVDVLRAAVEDLDQLAQDSIPWQKCEVALQVLVAAIRAQEGLVGEPVEQSDPLPDATATP